MITTSDPLGFGLVCPFRYTSERDFATAAGKPLVGFDLEELLGTVPGEIRWRPSFGTNVSKLRMRPNTGALSELARIEVQRAVAKLEPRIAVADVSATRDAKNMTTIKVAYKVGVERETRTTSTTI